jgi:DDE superfamily endonuclease
VKNLVLATEQKRIVYLSETVEGSHSEKRLADEADFAFGPDGSTLLALLMDLGFPAFQARGAIVVRPHKKPRGGQLTAEQKRENQLQASERVVVEHAISGVKIWRVVKEVFRSWLHERRDRVMYLACGLHNFRLEYRQGFIQP